MKKGEKKKMDRALKKRTKRQQAKRSARVSGPPSAKQIIYQARNYPIDSCWVLKNWQEQGISPVVIVRRQPNGNIVFASCLVDFFCLGVKDAFCNADIPAAEFHREYLSKLLPGELMSISPALAHEMIYGSIEFAARYGFKPHRDFKLTSYVLDPPEAHPRSGAVEFGKDGEPFYIAGPYDDVDAIMRKLMAASGGSMPKYLIPIGPPPDDWFDDDDEFDVDDDEYEEDEDEDEDVDEVGQEDEGTRGTGDQTNSSTYLSSWIRRLGRTRS